MRKLLWIKNSGIFAFNDQLVMTALVNYIFNN